MDHRGRAQQAGRERDRAAQPHRAEGAPIPLTWCRPSRAAVACPQWRVGRTERLSEFRLPRVPSFGAAPAAASPSSTSRRSDRWPAEHPSTRSGSPCRPALRRRGRRDVRCNCALAGDFGLPARAIAHVAPRVNGTRNAARTRSAHRLASAAIGVREVPGGLVSTWLVNDVRPGDSVDVQPPAGTFTRRRPSEQARADRRRIGHHADAVDRRVDPARPGSTIACCTATGAPHGEVSPTSWRS